MAKRAPGVKSKAIKDYLATNKNASPKQIVEALKAKGIEVSFGLASVVKYSKGKKKAAAKESRQPTVTVKAGPAVSGSELIRQFIAKNRKAGPKEIEAGLKAEGITVKLSLINAVKYSKAKKGAKRRSKTPVVYAVARATPSSVPTFEQLIQVKQLADLIGGADQVRAALDALAQLQ